MATSKFMYNGENTTIKWAWLTADNNPYWSHTLDQDIDGGIAEYTHILTNDCGKYRIHLETVQREVRKWIEDCFCYTAPETTFQVWAWVYDLNANSTIQKVQVEVSSFAEATLTVEELAHKAVKWCLNRR